LEKHVPHFSGRYIEPFFGGGALFFHLQPRRAIINDINEKLMFFYQSVKCNFDELKSELAEIEGSYRKNRITFEMSKSHAPGERVQDPNEGLYYHLRDMFNGLVDKRYSEALLYFLSIKPLIQA